MPRLAAGAGDGWRYDSLPEDGAAYRSGLDGLQAAAVKRGSESFATLDAAGRDAVLRSAAAHDHDDDAAPGFDTGRWFEELLVDVTEAHVAHPAAQLQMGCTAFADLPPDEPSGFDRAPYRRSDAGSARGAAMAEAMSSTPSSSAPGPVAGPCCGGWPAPAARWWPWSRSPMAARP